MKPKAPKWITADDPAAAIVISKLEALGFQNTYDRHWQCGVVCIARDTGWALQFCIMITGKQGFADMRHVGALEFAEGATTEEKASAMVKAIADALVDLCPLFVHAFQ